MISPPDTPPPPPPMQLNADEPSGLSNQMDYSRFARKPGDQVFGQYFSIIFFGIIMPLFGCLSSSATQGVSKRNTSPTPSK